MAKRRVQVSNRRRRQAHGFVASAPGVSGAREGVGGDPGVDDSRGVRLNRWLAERGVASRRKADELVQGGSVTVNGKTLLEPGYRVQPGDEIMVQDSRVREVARLYYAFNKPKGVICTDDPREQRRRLRDLIEPLVPSRVYPIGRLDEDSEGLILLTNDGDFANLIAHPRYGVPKTYMVQVIGDMPSEAVAKMRQGVHLSDGKVVPERVRLVRRGRQTSSLEVVLREGRNREVRRLLARLGIRVKGLKRVRIGEIGLRGVPRAGLRPLTVAERDALVLIARGERDAAHAAGKRAARAKPPASRKAPGRPRG
ncbi:MAG TPA: pseudouridine synthase [Planctomycetota bacterium]